MSRSAKIYISINGGERCREALAGADDIDLAILGGLCLLASEDSEVSVSELEESGKFESADIRASVKYWRGAGVLSGARQQGAAGTERAVQTAHKDGVITHSGVEKYTNDELAEVLSGRVSTAFVDEAQKALGKIFNNGEVGKLVGLVDQLGFEEEAVLAILSYCVRLGKKSLSYAEKIAVSFHDEDISTAAAVHAHIDELERRATAIGKVQSLFGFNGRALSATEKKLFGAWTEEYGFDMEIIKRAYELTVDSIHEPAPKYTDKILSKWHSASLKTLSEVNAFIEADRKKTSSENVSVDSKGKNAVKNQEIDDWFEQRLQKSFK